MKGNGAYRGAARVGETMPMGKSVTKWVQNTVCVCNGNNFK